MADPLRVNLITQVAKELKEYTTCNELDCRLIVGNILTRHDELIKMRASQEATTSTSALPISDVVISEERAELVFGKCNGIGYTQNEKTGYSLRCMKCNFV
jgi:hypothetical protein